MDTQTEIDAFVLPHESTLLCRHSKHNADKPIVDKAPRDIMEGDYSSIANPLRPVRITSEMALCDCILSALAGS